MIAVEDERDKDNIMDNVLAYQGQNFRLDQTNYR